MSDNQSVPVNKTPRYLRLWEIIGSHRRKLPPKIPVAASTWWKGIREGRFPRGRKLSPNVTVWLEDDIIALIEHTYNCKESSK